MTDLLSISDQISSKARRTYSQRDVSSLQFELTKNRKLINVKPSKTTIINRTLSFKPLPVTSSLITNVENTPMKKISNESNRTLTIMTEESIEETPIKDENDEISTEKMTKDIQRLAHRLRSSVPLYDKPIFNNQSTRTTALHLSQVANRVSRCNYVLRHFVKEAQKYSIKSNEAQSKSTVSTQSHEKSRRRLFMDSPKHDLTGSFNKNHQQRTPRRANGVNKELFASPRSSFKRTCSSSSDINFFIDDKRQKFF